MAAPEALYTSPLGRAEATAEILAQLWRLDPIRDSGLKEIYCGELEGARIGEIEDQCPDLWARNMAQYDDEFAWPGGESYAAFRCRVVHAISIIAGRHERARVALVTHAGVINQLAGIAVGRRPAEWSAFRPDPLTVSEILWNGAQPVLTQFNQPL
jgi:broad specificity phosphatase PhoE